MMKKNLTEIIFILDRSGSMSGLEADTIGGFNSMCKSQYKNAGFGQNKNVGFPTFLYCLFPTLLFYPLHYD